MIVENLIRKEVNEGTKRIYFYRIIKNELELGYGSNMDSVQSYGIEIERQDIIKDRLVNICRDSVKIISPDRYKVHNLLKLLYNNEVSPLHLVDVIGSYADEYIFDFNSKIGSVAY